MENEEKKFHEFALESGLFKGRVDLYFCYLKSERIAQALAMLARNFSSEDLNSLCAQAEKITQSFLQLALGEVEIPKILVGIFSLISGLKISMSKGALQEGNALLIITEYEILAERIGSSGLAISFMSATSFAVPDVSVFRGGHSEHALVSQQFRKIQPALDKRQDKGQSMSFKISKRQEERTNKILTFVQRHERGVSIREIADIVRECSEKTIQRELIVLIQQGAVKKVGERRWSLYLPASLS